MAQVREGIAGWICGLLPLIVVNLLGYLGLLNTEEALLAGAVALLGGPLVGGAVAGWLGGRPSHSTGGMIGAITAGAIAGALYLVSLLGLVVVAADLGAEPQLLAEHPIRVGLAALCLSCVLAVVALGVGALAGRGASRAAVQPAAVRQRQEPSNRPSARPGTRPNAPTPTRLGAAGPAARATGRQSAAIRGSQATSSKPSRDRDTQR